MKAEIKRSRATARAAAVVVLVVAVLAAIHVDNRAVADSGVNKARPFSASSPWNTPTPAGTSWFDTTRLHSLSKPLSNGDSFRHWWINDTDEVGIWWSSPTDPVWTFNMPKYVALAYHRNRPATTFTMRAPANIAPSTGSDHMLVVIDATTGQYVEAWLASVNATTHTVTSNGPGWATGNAITGPGAGTLSNNDGVRAANFSVAAGVITGADLAAGKIDHALEVSLPADMLKGGNGTPNPYLAPATAADAGGWGGNILMGSRIGIPAGTPMPAGLSPVGVMMFNALQTYGAFVGDYTGGTWPAFSADSHTVTDAQVCPVFCYWDHGGSSDMEKIGPILRVADYQPLTPTDDVSVGAAAAVEGNSGPAGSLVFPVTLTDPPTMDVTMHYAISSTGSATAGTKAATGVDFKASSGTLTFKAGSATTKYIVANEYPDTTTEGNETFAVALSSPSYGLVLKTASALGTIINDDPSTGLRVAVGNASIWEGNRGASNTVKVPLTLSAPAPSAVSVTVTVGGGTAIAGVDYSKAFTKTVTFIKGSRQVNVLIPVIPNTTPQANRTITVTLSRPTPSTVLALGRSVGTVTINDDD